MKKFLSIIIICVLLTLSLVSLVGCNQPEEEEGPKEVEIIIHHPYTREYFKPDTVLEWEWPAYETPFVFDIQEKETNDTIEDRDLPGTTLKQSVRVSFEIEYFNTQLNKSIPMDNEHRWPTIDDVNLQETPVEDIYIYVNVSFDAKPRWVEESNYDRQYKQATTSFIFLYKGTGTKLSGVDIQFINPHTRQEELKAYDTLDIVRNMGAIQIKVLKLEDNEYLDHYFVMSHIEIELYMVNKDGSLGEKLVHSYYWPGSIDNNCIGLEIKVKYRAAHEGVATTYSNYSKTETIRVFYGNKGEL